MDNNAGTDETDDAELDEDLEKKRRLLELDEVLRRR